MVSKNWLGMQNWILLANTFSYSIYFTARVRINFLLISSFVLCFPCEKLLFFGILHVNDWLLLQIKVNKRKWSYSKHEMRYQEVRIIGSRSNEFPKIQFVEIDRNYCMHKKFLHVPAWNSVQLYHITNMYNTRMNMNAQTWRIFCQFVCTAVIGSCWRFFLPGRMKIPKLYVSRKKNAGKLLNNKLSSQLASME